MISEGCGVAYAGDADPFNQVGSLGKVVALSGSAAHVLWIDGPKVGQVDLVEQHELVERQGRATAALDTIASGFDNSLDMPEGTGLQVRATYDEYGEDGLVNVLSETGHLAVLSEYVDEAVGTLATRIRGDINLRQVLTELEADEADSLVGKVAAVLLTDRLEDR